jgi:peptidoglycan/LPS O-acetylase OafA/YrhL
VIVLAALGLVAVTRSDLLFAATYTMNFHADRAWSVGHLWSLAVEEQFYLLWPMLLVVFGLRRASSFAIGAILLAPVVRMLAWYATPQFREFTDQAFPCIFDSLATGCALAIGRRWLEASARYRKFLFSPWLWLLLAGCTGSLAITRPWFQLGFAMTGANIMIAVAIHRCVLTSEGPLAEALRHPLAVRVGTLSYSLYLWQQLFLNRHASSWFNAFPVNIVFAFLAAHLCHRLIEQPFLRLSARHRPAPLSLENPASPVTVSARDDRQAPVPSIASGAMS